MVVQKERKPRFVYPDARNLYIASPSTVLWQYNYPPPVPNASSEAQVNEGNVQSGYLVP